MDNILINDSLFKENIKDYEAKDLEYSLKPDTVGICTNYIDNKKVYILYVNDERGNIEYCQEYKNFFECLTYARTTYHSLYAYYQGIINDCANIRTKK